MNIIGGKYRGKKLKFVSSTTTRPTSCKTRESVFNLIGLRVRDARVLDLFGGSGSFCVEAISRGAKSVVVNDICGEAVKIIKENLSAIDSLGPSKVLNLDYVRALDTLKGEKFDLVFLDPPYGSGFGEKVIDYMVNSDMLSMNAMIVFETGCEVGEDILAIWERTFEIKMKKYGIARVYILVRQ